MLFNTKSRINPFTFLLLVSLVLLSLTSKVSAYTQICRCNCASNYTIVELPDYANLSCTNCTKKFCLSKNFTICEGVDEMLVSAACFQRESLKEQFFIYIFIIITSTLLLYAAIAPYFPSGFGLRRAN